MPDTERVYMAMLGGDITYGFKYFKSRVVQEINSQDKLILAEGNTNSQLLMSKQVNIVKCINIMGVKRVHCVLLWEMQEKWNVY